MVNNIREANNMKFAVILREAGYSTEEFKECSKIDVVLYDRKERINTAEDLHFVEKLFANCEGYRGPLVHGPSA